MKELDLAPPQQFLSIHLTTPRSGSAARSSDGKRSRQAQREGNPSSSMQNDRQMPNVMNSSKAPPARDEVPDTYPEISSSLISCNLILKSMTSMHASTSFLY